MTKKLVTKTLITMLGTALALSVSSAAFAAGGGGYGPKFYSMKTMGVIDLDFDHKVTRVEFMAFHEKMFAAMDKNGDGDIDKSEWLANANKGQK